ncbi:NAD-binding protein, partial [Vibrio parahaemolyticus]
LQRGPEVLSTLDPELGSLVHDELTRHGVDVRTDTRVDSVARDSGRLTVTG